ncbi:hypothetical protein ACTWPB_12730 [Nocardia sp. IBHARD005]|uniref:hypothetical protein n=1 Tax=Nocardia sp. IBHARD005 TaxID=3457765 RepID=UPI0040585629
MAVTLLIANGIGALLVGTLGPRIVTTAGLIVIAAGFAVLAAAVMLMCDAKTVVGEADLARSSANV